MSRSTKISYKSYAGILVFSKYFKSHMDQVTNHLVGGIQTKEITPCSN